MTATRTLGARADGLRPSDLLATFFGLGILFLVAAAVCGLLYGLADWTPGRLLGLHLVFVGGISQLVLGASQFFVGAFLATTPPSRRLVRCQLATWNLGAVLVPVGVAFDEDVAAGVGAPLLVLGLALLVAGLRSMERRSLQTAIWAARWYYACAAFLAVGVIAGAALALDLEWRFGNLLGAHLALNLAGWFGTAIVGTLHTFYPSLTQTRLALPRLQGPAFMGWVAGVAALAGGQAFATDWLALGGWACLAVAALLLATNIALSTHAAERPLALPARLIALAQAFLVAGLAAGFVFAASSGDVLPPVGPERSALAVLLLAGWLGLTVLGSLLHLLSVLVRVRDLTRAFPRAHRRSDVPIAVLAAVGVAGLAAGRLSAADGLVMPAALALGLVYALVMARVLALAFRAARRGPLGV